MSDATAPDLDLSVLACDLDARGVAGCEESLQAVALRARAAAVDAVLVDVLADPTAPEVARMRAFGRIAVLLDRRPGRDDGPALRCAA